MGTGFQEYGYTPSPGTGGTAGTVTGNEYDGVVFTAPNKPTTATDAGSSAGTNAWTSLLNGANLTGIANIISSVKGTPYGTVVNNAGTPTATTAATNSTWLILGAVILLGALAFFFMKKD